ncbi:MAG: glycosyltransferase family 4 protein [Candidatus Aureabacteria bacterium]|nr:glycosyltransferase family 4 protein [Candidatus Auribacterota bacterium]
MKIVCISVSQVPSIKANSIQLMKVCQAFAQLGHDVTVLVPSYQPSFSVMDPSARAVHYGLTCSFPVEYLTMSPFLRTYDFCLTAVRQARSCKGDVIYTRSLPAAVFALLLRIPVLLEMHAPPEGRFGPLIFRLFLSLSGKKRLLPISKALADILDSGYNISRRSSSVSVVVSHDGVDLERYQDLPDSVTARRILALPEIPTAVCTGNLYDGRGRKMVTELARRLPHMQFLWIGGDSKAVECWRAQLAGDKISNIILTGFIENSRLPLYQAAAEVLLMPYERMITGSSGGNTAAFCSPLKMFEYMASNRPVISSDLPVIREVLNSANAVLCPPDELEAWEHSLRLLLEDPGKRNQLASQARQDADCYTWIRRQNKILEGFSKG